MSAIESLCGKGENFANLNIKKFSAISFVLKSKYINVNYYTEDCLKALKLLELICFVNTWA